MYASADCGVSNPCHSGRDKLRIVAAGGLSKIARTRTVELCPIRYRDTLIRDFSNGSQNFLPRLHSGKDAISPCILPTWVHVSFFPCSGTGSTMIHDQLLSHAQACLHGWANDMQVSCPPKQHTLGTQSAKGRDGHPSADSGTQCS